MADNLRVTTPINTSENISKLTPTKTNTLVDAVMPERVSSRNTSEQASKSDIPFELNRNSVYNRYIQMLKTTPALKSCMEEILFSALFQQTYGAGRLKRKDRLQELLANSIKMDKSEMLKNIDYQVKNTTKFSGPLFNFLRQLYFNNPNEDFRLALGSFLKAYDGYFSADETLKSIFSNLNEIVNKIPKSYADGVIKLIESLNQNLSNDAELVTNLDILKNQIIPKLAEYVARTNDFSDVRDDIALLLYNTSRLNTASKANLLDTFEELLGFCRYNTGLNIENAVVMQKLFERELENNNTPQNQFFDTLMGLISRLPQSKANANITTKDLASSLLLDNSVFNPFIHVFLPVNYQGKHMFTEIWIAPDTGGNQSQQSQSFKLFLTFDIKRLGYFEAVLLVNQNTTSAQIKIPPSLDADISEVQSRIKQIFADNSLTVKELEIVRSSEQRQVFEVFPNISRRRGDIDVTV